MASKDPFKLYTQAKTEDEIFKASHGTGIIFNSTNNLIGRILKDKKDVYVFYLESDLDLKEVTLSKEHGNVQFFTYKEILDLKKY